MTNSVRTLLSLAGVFVIPILLSYFTTQITVEEKLGKRPTRQEVEAEVNKRLEDTMRGLHRELDSIRAAQNTTYSEIQEIRRALYNWFQAQQGGR